MIYRPTPEYIYHYMIATCSGYLPSVDRKTHIKNYFFTVYIPNDFFNISIIKSSEIIQKWLRLTENDSLFNISNWLRMFKNEKIYTIQTENIHTYDWFILLSICAENNFIIDSTINYKFGGTIYDIESASERLKVRI